MSWEVALFIALPLFFIIGNIMMVKHSAKMKMPSLKDHMPDKKKEPHSEPSADKAKVKKTSSESD
jgi:hypothetical protein